MFDVSLKFPVHDYDEQAKNDIRQKNKKIQNENYKNIPRIHPILFLN